jgi:hypothetical protein
MLKILTPVNLGSFALSHRVVTVISPRASDLSPISGSGQIAAGGLVIHSFPLGLAAQAHADEQISVHVAAWQSFNDAIRLNGGTSIARIVSGGMAGQLDSESAGARSTGFGDWAVLAQQAGFDGAELDASAYPSSQPTEPLLETVQDIIAVWGAERVGVQLGPFAFMSGLEDIQLADFYGQLISVLVEMEVAYIHIAGTYTSDRCDLSSSPLGRHIRRVFPGMLIASGAYTPVGAIAVVESRWADAIAFTMMMGDGATFLAAIRHAGMTPRPAARRP